MFETNGVTSIAFSPDSKTLVSGGWDDTTRLWEIASGSELFRQCLNPCDDSAIRSVAYSPDGRTLAASGHLGTVLLWDSITGQEIRKLDTLAFTGTRFDVPTVVFSPDGKTLVGSQEDWVLLWDVPSGRQRRKFKVHIDGEDIVSLALSPNGSLLACSSKDATIRIWDLTSSCEWRSLAGEKWPAASLAFSLQGRILASAWGRDKLIRVWETTSGEEIKSIQIASPTYTVAFSPDGTRLAWGDQEGNVALRHLSVRAQIT